MAKSKKDSDDTKISPDKRFDPQTLREMLALPAENGGRKRIKIRLISGSMSPLLPTGSFAEIEACTIDELKFLDVIVFDYKSQLTCHCFFAQGEFPTPSGERTIVTRGIASKYYDLPISESSFVGRVVTHKISSSKFLWYRLLNKVFGVKLTEKIFG